MYYVETKKKKWCTYKYIALLHYGGSVPLVHYKLYAWQAAGSASSSSTWFHVTIIHLFFILHSLRHFLFSSFLDLIKTIKHNIDHQFRETGECA